MIGNDTLFCDCKMLQTPNFKMGDKSDATLSINKDFTVPMNTQCVSVIVPAWNAAAHITQCLESVLSQTHSNLEIIVVNDCSDDRTADIVRSFVVRDARVTSLNTNVNSGGPATPRNIGIRQASGHCLAFLDADDVWHPKKLELQLEAMRLHDLAFVSTEHQEFSGEFDLPLEPQLGIQGFKPNTHRMLLMKNNVTTSSAMVRAHTIRGVWFDERAGYRAIEDYAMWLSLHQQPDFKSGIISNRLVYYRRRSDSLSSSGVIMATKVFKLLRDYEIAGKQLGWRRFIYFTTYVVLAMRNKVVRRFSLCKSSAR